MRGLETYQPNKGAVACIAASVNHYVPTSGSTRQLACPAGTDQPLTGQAACVPDSGSQVTTQAAADLVAGTAPGRTVTG